MSRDLKWSREGFLWGRQLKQWTKNSIDYNAIFIFNQCLDVSILIVLDRIRLRHFPFDHRIRSY
jgi:hypothetical protein